MNKTKKKILSAAITLFNEKGVMNVLNHEIAEKSEVSLSNFNYHFKTKKGLVYAVCTLMKEELDKRTSSIQILTREGKGLDLSRMYFEFAYDFKFFYMDTHNILQMYPAIRKEMQAQIDDALQIIKNINYLAIGIGYMKPEPVEMPGLYDSLTHQIWINSHFWLAQMNIRGVENNAIIEGLEAYFAICYPYLTDSGKTAYKNYIEALKNNKKKAEITD